MQVISDVSQLQSVLAQYQQADRTLGFCPTMGALHAGHLRLIEYSRRDNDLTVASIYVNPTQFNDTSDLAKYPRQLEEDSAKLKAAGCDVLFCPNDDIMYPKPAVISLDFGLLEQVMEGKHRPGHFNGVGLVVSKLLHLVRPHRAYFGQKDFQQFAIIRQLVEDLMFPVQLVRVPTEREPDGLAMSSRNGRLSPEGRATATELYAALVAAKEQLLAGHSYKAVVQAIQRRIEEHPGIALEYFEIAHAHTLQPQLELNSSEPTVLCIAAYVEGVRLIDNLTLFA